MSSDTATAPAEIWRWEGGTSGNDNLYGAVAAADGSVVLTGRTQGGWDGPSEGDFDFMAVMFKGGAELWRLQAGTAEEDSFHDAVVATTAAAAASSVDAQGLESASPTIVLAGFTRGDWSGAGRSSGGGSGADFAALGLDADGGSELWRWQDGTEGDDVMVGAVVDAGGSSVVLAGRTEGDWATANAGGSDFAAVKLRADDGSELWRFQDGSSEDDTLKSIAVAGDGTFILAGYTGGGLGGPNAGETDLVAVKLSPEGEVVWRWQGGTAFADVLSTALVEEDGSIIMAGYTTGSWVASNAGEEDYLVVKLDSDGNEVWVWQDGTSLKDRLFASALCKDGSVVLAGYSEGNWAEANAGGSDLAAVKLDVAVGTEIWRWQDGTPGSDWVTAATATGGGSVVLAGTSERVWQGPTSSEPSGTTSAAAAIAGLTTEDYIAIKLDADCEKGAPPSTPAPTEFGDLASGSGSASASGELAAGATPAPFRPSAAGSASSSVSVNDNGAGGGETDGLAPGTSEESVVLQGSSYSSETHSLAAGSTTPAPTPTVAAEHAGGTPPSPPPSPAPSPSPAPFAIVVAPAASPAAADTRAPVDAGSTVRSSPLSSDNDDGVGSATSDGLSLAPSLPGIGGGGGVLLFCFAAACAVRRASSSVLSF